MTGFQRCYPFIAYHEGGRADIKSDPGKLTWYGISKRAHPPNKYPNFWKNPTPHKAKMIFRTDYWAANRLYLLQDHVAVVALDMLIHHRPKDAIRVLQRGAGRLKADGVMGKKTRARLNEPGVSIPRILQYRLALFDKIIKKNPAQIYSLDGWRWRTNCLNRFALGIEAGISVRPNGKLARN